VYAYYDIGQLRSKVTLKDGESDGPYEWYYQNGQLQTKATYVAGQLDGPIELYNENGQLLSKGALNMGHKCGVWLESGQTVTYDPCPPSLEDGN
jgi:antitoxin component YwqK of YwqJK toxin-antitoxin module